MFTLSETINHTIWNSYELKVYGATGVVTWEFATPEAAVYRINDWLAIAKNFDTDRYFSLTQIDHRRPNRRVLVSMSAKEALNHEAH